MDDTSLAILRKALKEGGYSMTAPRRIVCELLWSQEPQSMQELTMRSKGRIDRASLYRTIALFERLGLAQRIYVGWKYKVELSDVLARHHHHISCTMCGKLAALHDDNELEKVISQLAAAHGFANVTHQLEVQGICPGCQRRTAG